MSTCFMKCVVASLPLNSGRSVFCHRKSLALAIEQLSVCAAILTFILCFVQKMCCFFILFAKENPRSSWTLVGPSMYCHLILCIVPFSSQQMTFWSPNKFCISIIIWQTSKTTWTFAFGICGWGNQVWMLDKSIIQPSWVAMLWLPNVPWKTNAVTNKSSWCSNPMQSLISWSWTDAEILFCKK